MKKLLMAFVVVAAVPALANPPQEKFAQERAIHAKTGYEKLTHENQAVVRANERQNKEILAKFQGAAMEKSKIAEH